jgi:hypothetical protein
VWPARIARTALVAAAATLSVAARAGSPTQAGAAELLDSEATSLMQEHRYAEACPKLAESDRIQPGTGVLLRLALCYELSGRTASAWASFREAAGRAHRVGDESVAELASRRAEGLEPRLAKLVVRLSGDSYPMPVDVRLDGSPLAASTLGVEVPIDPGPHTLKAVAAGRRSFVKTFSVAVGGGVTAIAVELPPELAPGGPSPRRTAAIAAGGVGLACVAVGSILGIAAMSNWNRAKSECTRGTSGCSREALDLQSTVNNEALGSTVAFTAGAVGIAAGAVLWLTSPPASGGRREATVLAPSTDGHRFGLSLSGTF